MRIGLPLLQQIEGGPSQLLGGFTSKSLKQIAVGVTSGYHKEHNEDDTHKAITSTGAITERSRTTAQGVWIDVLPTDVVFAAGAGAGWSVRAANMSLLAYMLVGTTMTVSWDLRMTSVVGTPASLYFTIGDVITPTRTVNGTFHYNNNGTYGIGRCTVGPIAGGMQGVRITLYLVNLGNWSAAVNNTDVTGQFAFEVDGV